MIGQLAEEGWDFFFIPHASISSLLQPQCFLGVEGAILINC